MRFLERSGGIVKRPRRYRYSSLLGWLPGAHAVFFIGLGLSVFVWMVGGPSGHEWLGILPTSYGCLSADSLTRPFSSGAALACVFVARRVGLTFSRKSSQWWEPPPASYPVSISKTRNRLEGKFEGEPVVVFDAEVGWRSTSSDTCSRRRRGFSQRFFSVVELAAPPGTPRILIGGRWESRFNSVPIAGTEYYLHGASREMRQASGGVSQ